MSRPDSNYVIESAYRRIQEAWKRLREAGFDTPNHEHRDDGPWKRKAAEWFNSSTLWKVFGLAEIISEEAPLTVRRAMCGFSLAAFGLVSLGADWGADVARTLEASTPAPRSFSFAR
jgi:hypothetical protein